jgi:hypothetical protein
MPNISSPGLSLAGDEPAAYLVLAGLCLLVGLYFVKRALEPFRVLLEAAVAATVVAFSLGATLILLLAAIAAS